MANPGLSQGGTGTSSPQTAGSIPWVPNDGGGTGNRLGFVSVTSGQFLRSGGGGAPTGFPLFEQPNTWTGAQTIEGAPLRVQTTFEMQDDGAVYRGVLLYAKPGNILQLRNSSGSGSIRLRHDSDLNGIDFYTGGAASFKMRIRASDGWVGMGTQSPMQRLHVVGRTQAEGFDAEGDGSVARSFRMFTSGVLRWITRANITGEAGANSGSDYQIVANDDNGNGLWTAFHIYRALPQRVGIGTNDPLQCLHVNETETLSANKTDGFSAALRLTPTYNGAFTVTRHNQIDFQTPTGTSTITDAVLVRYNAAAGTHKGLDSGTTKSSPGTVSAWEKRNVNGTIMYAPLYTSKTS